MKANKRDKVLEKMHNICNELTKNYTWDQYNLLCAICSDWNNDHEDEEIFLCDTDDGIAIEDDIYRFAEH